MNSLFAAGEAINRIWIANETNSGFSPLASCGTKLILLTLADEFRSFTLIPSGLVSISQSLPSV